MEKVGSNIERKENQSDVKYIVLIGRPGSGKDTQGDILSNLIPNSFVISTGDIVRGLQDPKSEFSKNYPEFIERLNKEKEESNNGGLVSDELILEIVDKIIAEKTKEGIETFIFTGFPRTEVQLEEFEKKFGEATYIELKVPRSVSEERANIRKAEADALGKPHRPDDDKVETRNDNFDDKTQKMVDVLKSQKRIVEIIGTKSIKDVTNSIVEAVPEIFAYKDLITRDGKII